MTPIGRRDLLKGGGAALLAGFPPGITAVGEPPPKSPERRIKVGQIGVAHGHATKLSTYRESPDYEVVGIVEPDEALRKRAADLPAFRGLPWMTRDQLLNTPGLEAVLVETRVQDLLETAEHCVAAGKHVHLDKPAGASLPRLRKLLDAATAKGLMVQMGYMYRYNPGVILLRECLIRGWLGEIFEVHAVMSKVVPLADRERFAAFPGGMMFELGCHLIDLIVGLCGKPDVVTPYLRDSASAEVGLMDNTLAVLQYPKVLATVKSSALEVEGFGRRHLVVCGTGGTLQIQPLDDPSVRLTLEKPCGEYRAGTQEIKLPKFVRYVADAAHMAKSLRTGEIQFTTPHDLDVQEAVLRASGMPIDA